jgi:DNA-binding CsgD family transcriptional regulator
VATQIRTTKPKPSATQLKNSSPRPQRELDQQFFDELTKELYLADGGVVPWLQPLQALCAALDLWAVHFLGVDKHAGSMLFSYEAGNASPESGLDYLREYQHVDPRMVKTVELPPMTWFACHEYFDDAFVAASPFYQDFLIPHGGRYLLGCKLIEDETKFVIIGMLGRSDRPPLNALQRQFVERLGHHVANAFRLQEHLRTTTERSAVGYELLKRMRQPILLVDAARNITFRNAAAQAILDAKEFLIDSEGTLICADNKSGVSLTTALRDMVLTPFNSQLPIEERTDRRSVKLERRSTGAMVVVTLIALRPESTSSAFGTAPQALVTIYEPGRLAAPDPFLLSATFDLTPAEARLVSRMCAGLTIQQAAKELGVTINTVKGHLKSIFSKTGTNRQADLTRLLITASTF